MKLSKMVEETLTTEEIEVIEEKKKCKKKKQEILLEDDMKYCKACGTSYDLEATECPNCGSTETTTKCEAMKFNIAKQEATINAGTVEDVATAEAKLKADKVAYTAGCEEKETPALPAPAPEDNGKLDESINESEDMLVEEPVTAEETAELEWLKSLAGN